MTATPLPGATRPTSGSATRSTARAGAVRTYLRLELRRMLRDRRTLLFSLLVPPALFLWVGASADNQATEIGPGTNLRASLLVSIALFGALLTAASGGAGVAVERAQGWTRQLRLTPLEPWTYVLVKVLASMAVGAVSVLVTFAAGWFGGAQMPTSAWVLCALIAWCGSFVFAAFGLLMGYVLPTESVLKLLNLILAALSFAGGLFLPFNDGTPMAAVSRLMPTYGLAELARAPLGSGSFEIVAVVNVVAWAAIFFAGAAWRFRKDTARV
ncbi:ABC-2 type transport system permease protein [Promicromonospora umidemergens]|uniref:ABC transporter permease n=1 Tax=Promicromonospora umidemergens TaxID=629679 RepID=A0ABP8X9D7_9MICO|nr:ABC transporter permease [Promicromonospora umidemergens]MCP2281376.1 ABC-2 type transport system permease protein [Promicromonospora umidemergens]